MKKKLLLHSCCAPCSSGVIPQLQDFDITLLFYNPNIDTVEEYNRRLDALKDYVQKYNKEYETQIKYIAIPYNHDEFLKNTTTLQEEKEGGIVSIWLNEKSAWKRKTELSKQSPIVLI